MLHLGVIGTSRKENENRLPVHGDHLEAIPARVRPHLRFETGYAEPFGIDDAVLAERFGGVASRRTLLAESDVVLLPKVLPEDLAELREGGILWGWPHCVQQPAITQVAIDRKQTLIAWEAMFAWKRGGVQDMHLFDRNNEMAGYSAVLHAFGLAGIDGHYGPPLRACVLSHGSVSRGAIHALQGIGVRDIRIFTLRPARLVHDKIPGCRYLQMRRGPEGMIAVGETGAETPLVDRLAEADVIVNGTLQDPLDPVMFFGDGDENRLRHGSLIVDVSCDLAMGFPFARPTSFEEPTFPVGPVTYYAVDHTPSYLWRSASWELSRVVIPYLETIVGGPEAWDADETIRRAIEIRDGVIWNPAILEFQGREEDYPHPVRG